MFSGSLIGVIARPMRRESHGQCGVQGRFGSEQRAVVLPASLQRAGTMTLALVRVLDIRVKGPGWMIRACPQSASATGMSRQVWLCSHTNPM